MPISIAGSGTITGISAGGLPDDCITTAEIAANAVTTAKLGSAEASGLCKAWVNFNGTGTVAIRASYNVSSITDNGTGKYTVNFTTAMADANYAWSGACEGESDMGSSAFGMYVSQLYNTAPTSSALAFATLQDNNTFEDSRFVHVAVFR